MKNDQGRNIGTNASGEIAADAMMVMEIIEKGFTDKFSRNDIDIANEVNRTLHTNPLTEADNFGLEVINGWVFLHGEEQRNYEKELLKNVVSNIVGVRGVTSITTTD